jgi:peptidoglycan LD-endopeptidase CwlK
MTIGLKELLEKADKKLQGVHPTVAAKARQLISQAYKERINVIITQGLRTIEEQNELYAQGRTKLGKIVTNAKGGYSYHNFGLAFDFAILNPDGSVNWTVDSKWKRVGAIGKSLGLEWGGDWKDFKDYPHFQYTFGLSLADLRAGKRPSIKPTATVASKKETKQQVASAIVPYPGKPLKLGSKGKDVERIQRALKVKADGIFGKQTEAAVKAYQKRKGLVADGIVGPQTWNMLF